MMTKIELLYKLKAWHQQQIEYSVQCFYSCPELKETWLAQGHVHRLCIMSIEDNIEYLQEKGDVS